MKEEHYVEKIITWEAKNDALETFETNKADYDYKLETAVKDLETEKITTEKRLKSLESAMILEKTKLRKQFEAKLVDVEATIDFEIQKRLRQENYHLYEGLLLY